jgi:hypothetical protein
MRALSLSLAIALVATQAVAGMSVVHGNIVLDGRAITSSGHDSAPLLSPDGRVVVFLRATHRPAKDCAADASDGKPLELWRVNSDGNSARRLLATHGGPNPEAVVCDFANLQFNSAGSVLYFETPAWATSGAIHALDLATGKERLFLPGNGLIVLARCRDKRYRDNIITGQHRYFVFSGSYDWAFLFTPEGKEIGPLGDGDFSSDLKDACD